MASRDPRVDAYIEKQAAFARPILEHLRAAIHRTSPDAEETIKWGMPFFTLNGQPLANMGAFKAHASFGFWRGRELTGAGEDKDGMGQFGKLASIADLPDEAALDALIRQAAALIESGAKKPRPAREAKPPLECPQTSPKPWPRARRRRPATTASRWGRSANIWNGSWRRSGPKRARAGSRRRSSGWPRARPATGNMRAAES